MSAVTVVSAVTASPPSAAVNQPSNVCPSHAASGSSPTAQSFVTARVASAAVPPCASNVTVQTACVGSGEGSTSACCVAT